MGEKNLFPFLSSLNWEKVPRVSLFTTGLKTLYFKLIDLEAYSGILRLRTAGILDFEMKQSHDISVTVVDELKESRSDLSHEPLSRSAIMTINVLNVNEKPYSPDFSYCVEENSAGTEVGGALRDGFVHLQSSTWAPCESSGIHLVSTDPDKNDKLRYSIIRLVPNDLVTKENFVIDESSGQIIATPNCADCLDYERQQNYTLTVRTTDGGGLFHDSTVYVQIVDMNEAPALQLPIGEEYLSCGGTFVGSQLTLDGRGTSKSMCVGCPLIFKDTDSADTASSVYCAKSAKDDPTACGWHDGQRPRSPDELPPTGLRLAAGPVRQNPLHSK